MKKENEWKDERELIQKEIKRRTAEKQDQEKTELAVYEQQKPLLEKFNEEKLKKDKEERKKSEGLKKKRMIKKRNR